MRHHHRKNGREARVRTSTRKTVLPLPKRWSQLLMLGFVLSTLLGLKSFKFSIKIRNTAELGPNTQRRRVHKKSVNILQAIRDF